MGVVVLGMSGVVAVMVVSGGVVLVGVGVWVVVVGGWVVVVEV